MPDPKELCCTLVSFDAPCKATHYAAPGGAMLLNILLLQLLKTSTTSDAKSLNTVGNVHRLVYLYIQSCRVRSYSINIRKFRDINKHHLFASFPSKYLHKYAYVFNLMLNKYMLKLVFALEPIFPSHFLILANICKTPSEFTFKRIFACKYSHSSKYLLCIASKCKEKPFSSLRPELIFGTFLENICFEAK